MNDPTLSRNPLPTARPSPPRPEAPPRPRRRRPRTTRRRPSRRFIPALLTYIDGFLPTSPLHLQQSDFLRRGRLLVASSFGFFLVSLFFGLQMSMAQEYPLTSVVVMFSGCGLSIANLLLLRVTRSISIPGALLCLETLAIQSFQAYNDLGLDDPVLLWTLVIPWLAAFLVGPTYGFVFAGLVMACTGGFYILETHGYPFRDYTGPEGYWLFYFLCASTLALFLGFLGWLYEGQTLKNLRAANWQLGRAHTDLQRSNRRTERILEGITDGFFSLDRSWRFTNLNSQAEDFLEKEKSEILGLDAQDYFAGKVGEEILDKLRTADREAMPVAFETFYSPLNRWFDVHVYPFEEGLSVYFNDITERKDYERRLIQAKEKAEELAQLKSSLLANMSHEIRTPLTAVLGFSSILSQEVAGEHQEFVQLIEQNGKRLMETLNSVLDLAQLERSTVTCNPERVDVRAEVEALVRTWQPLARERGLTLGAGGDADTMATLDNALFARVLNNLIGNAIKFTDEGGVVVSVSGNDEHVWVRVSDTGIGISASFLPHLFEEFRQESTGLARSYEGNGLGLAISRRLVHIMGGTIEVESEKGVGTSFTVQLPRKAACAEAATPIG